MQHGLDPRVDHLELVDQFGRQLPSGLAHHITRGHFREQRPGLPRGQRLLRPPGTSSTSCRCSRLIVTVREAPSSSRRSASSRSATVRSSRQTCRSDRVRNDPAEDMTAILFIQRAHAGDQTLPRSHDFWTAVYQAIDD
jgi:hypothetical protein